MKRLLFMLGAGILTGALALGQQAPAPAISTQASVPGATIAGHVVEQATGRPVKRASVSLRRVVTTAAEAAPAPAQNTTANAGAAGTAAGTGALGGTVGTSAAGGQRRGLDRQNIQELLQTRGGRGGLGLTGGNVSAQTANDGSYIFSDVAPGEYIVTVSQEQYLSQEYGQRTLTGRGTPITVQSGARLDNISFQLIRAGVIVGTVVDEDGIPMPGIQVQALTYDYRNGQRVFRTVGSARTTDDSGGYRLYYLTPGDYYVTAQPAQGFRANGLTGLTGGAGGQAIQDLIQSLGGLGGLGAGFGDAGGFGGGPGGFGGGGFGGGQGFGNRGGGQANPNPAPGRGGGAFGGRGVPDQQQAGGRRGGQGTQQLLDVIQNRARGETAAAAAPEGPQEAYAPTFYPGTTDPVQAAAVHLAAGAEVRGIDFNIRPVALATISGVVLQAVGTSTPQQPEAQRGTTPDQRGRGGQSQNPTPTPATPQGRGGARGTPNGQNATTPQGGTAPNAQAGTNPLQGLLANGARGQNTQNIIASLRDTLTTLNANGGLQTLLAGGALGVNGRATVSLIPIGAAGRGGWGQNSGGRATANEDGTFRITGVTPGIYNLVAASRTETGTTTAIQRIDISQGGAITGLSLQLRPGMTVPGQIYVDGQAPDTFRAQSLRVQLQPVDDIPGTGNIQAQVNADGSFQIPNAVPGAQYRVNMPGVQGGGYVIAGRYGSANALNAPLTIADEGTPLQLQIGFSPGRIEAVVADAGKPAFGVITVLVPADRGRVDLYRNANSDKDGKVVFANVTPGDYKIFAWEEIQQGAWQDPSVLEKFEDRGRLIHVEKAGAATEEVQIIRSETRL